MFLLISFILVTLVTETQSQETLRRFLPPEAGQETTQCPYICCGPGAVHNGNTCVNCIVGKVSKFDPRQKTFACLWCDPCKLQYSAAGDSYCKTCGQVAGEYWEQETGEITGNCRKCSTGSVRQAQKIILQKGDDGGIVGDIGGKCEKLVDGNLVDDDTSASDACVACRADKGQYSNEFGKAQCKLCPNGKQVDISLFNAKTGGECFKEEIDWDQSLENQKTVFTASCVEALACKACPAGYEGREGICRACGEGSMQAEAGQTSCTACAGGKYTDQNQRTSCKPCEIGKATNEEGRISCQLCEKGQAQGETGQTSCAGCAAGTYSDQTGQTGCKPCATGTAVAKVGQQECASCQAGSAQPLEGRISCVSFNR